MSGGTGTGGCCVRVYRFPNGGYAVIADEEEWAPVVMAARNIKYVERADCWNASWEEVYAVYPIGSHEIQHYFVRAPTRQPVR